MTRTIVHVRIPSVLGAIVTLAACACSSDDASGGATGTGGADLGLNPNACN